MVYSKVVSSGVLLDFGSNITNFIFKLGFYF